MSQQPYIQQKDLWLTIVDDDPDIRAAITYLAESLGIGVVAYGTATSFL